ncbi:TauD/TfdA family dioxygenase [Xenorhabdus sp. PR6a]|uniref:TauD/TfdA family dioxygenase n=1 Tax=Xenorhabdus sp. PR6a TaxID=3025877 RepID=UPI002359C419|nr:TauD/TfdA family dioxygenase [Xenorhabdus sp. PR6a]MDC9581607.1 TauD/TfdA family dioxygenase [Xenorhabdus sp. PR6a]
MSFKSYTRPPAWQGNAVFERSARFSQPLENLFQDIANGYLPSERDSSLRREIHKELELKSGVLFHESSTLNRLDANAFHSVFNVFCLWLGFPVPINQQGHYLKEVCDHGVRDSLNTPQRGHLTNQALAFHSDRADITVLGCWSPAAKGGAFRIRSSADVIKQVEQLRPAWFPYLNTPIAHDLRDEGEQPWILVPLLSETENLFILRYIRKFSDSVSRHGITQPQAVHQMLTEIDSIIEQPDHYAQLDFKKGMLVAVNNHITLHARTCFENNAQFQRCLLRCWLSSEFTRPLPKSFQPLFHNVAAGTPRGGIWSKKGMEE